MNSCLVLSICLFVMGNAKPVKGENEVKQGTFPFMALIYYSDDTILESGRRFTRNAILIRVQWLVSSTIDVNDDLAFPKKTLLARAGAVSIDANLTLNEDEFEQEREIIQVVHPSHINQTTWWYYDISLLKTLVPFNITSQVAPAALSNIQDFIKRTCYIIIYGRKYSNTSDLRILMQLPVQIQPPEVCEGYYKKDKMICSVTNDTNKSSYVSNFCERNSGGPLVCDDKVAGLQTYVNNCKEPHLHLLLAAWKEFIMCGVGEKCQKNECVGLCTAFDKDPPTTTTLITTTIITTNALTTKPERRSFTQATDSVNALAFNETKETVSSIITKEAKPISEPIAKDGANFTTTYIETSTPLRTTMSSEVTSTTSGTTILDVKLKNSEMEKNVTIIPKKPVKISGKKNEASTNIFKVLNFFLAVFISAIFV